MSVRGWSISARRRAGAGFTSWPTLPASAGGRCPHEAPQGVTDRTESPVRSRGKGMGRGSAQRVVLGPVRGSR